MKSFAIASLTGVLAVAAPAFAQHDAHTHHVQDASPAQEAHAPAHAHHGQPTLADASQPSLPSPSPLPAPTAAERAAAFPADLEGMDMRGHMDDNPLIAVFRGDRLEYGNDNALGWDLRAGVGRNFDKLWLRSEGERRDGRLDHASTELFWSHATGPWWDRTLGLRHDSGGSATRDWIAIGAQGLAPYKIEFEAVGYVGTSGRLAARVESEYEVLLTNRWILQPKLEANFYSRDDDENHIGKGLSDARVGLRLRYEFSPQLAPYAGYVWTRRFGGTADRAEAAGGDARDRAWVAGIRFWF